MIFLELELCCYIIFSIELQWSLLCFWSIIKCFFLFWYVRVWNTLFSLEEYIRNKVYNSTTCHAMSCRVSPPCLPASTPAIDIHSFLLDGSSRKLHSHSATRPGPSRPNPPSPSPSSYHPSWSLIHILAWILDRFLGEIPSPQSGAPVLADVPAVEAVQILHLNVWCPERPELISRCREKFIICTTLWLYA